MYGVFFIEKGQIYKKPTNAPRFTKTAKGVHRGGGIVQTPKESRNRNEAPFIRFVSGETIKQDPGRKEAV